MTRKLLLVPILFINCAMPPRMAFTPGIDLPEFHHRSEIAGYFVVYDKIAWATTDSLMKNDFARVGPNLGQEWFCYRNGGKWLAVYGKYEDGKYKPGIRYGLDNGTLKISIDTSGDSSIEYKCARIINETFPEIQKLRDSLGMTPNWYLFPDSARNEISIWYLSALGKKSEVIYGYNIGFVYDLKGMTLKKKVFEVGEIRYFVPDRAMEIEIDNTERKIPTIEQIFIAERYHGMFKKIRIRNKNGVSEYVHLGGDRYSWMTVHR